MARQIEFLRERADFIAEGWYRALVGIGYVPASTSEVRQQLVALVEQVISLLDAEQVDPSGAEEIGASLARRFRGQPRALGRTLTTLSQQLSAGLTPEQVAALLGGLGTGFAKQMCATLLEQQEEIRGALVHDLRSAQSELRAVNEELEDRVQRRTRDLERINKELRQEIAERERVAAALRESEEQFRSLADQSPNMIFINRMGHVVYVNRRAEEMMGYTKEEFAAGDFDFLTLIAPEHRERAMSAFRKHRVGEDVEPIEYALVTKGGRRLETIVSTRLVEFGGEWAILGVVTDITQRKEAEEALRESKERWRSLVENAPDLVLTVDREGRVLFINRPVTARSTEEALGKNILGHSRSGGDEALAALIQRVFETGQTQYFEGAGPGPGGATAWYGTRMGPVWRDGQVTAVMMVTRDITDQKRLEEMKDNLIRDVSHELRTPLAKIQMGMELLMELVDRETIERGRVARIGEVTNTNVRRLLQTVEGILDLSSLETGNTAYDMQPIPVAQLVDEVVLDMLPLAEAKGLELAVDLSEDLCPIEGDWTKLYRVLTNLVDNAVKFTNEGTVVISARQNEEGLELAVSDPGQGILEENLEQIFERFFQEKPRVPGVGVGLTISQAIVQAHGGRLWAESAGRGLGSTFHLVLPQARSQSEAGQ
jgi:PAS domain S-box-containing protein